MGIFSLVLSFFSSNKSKLIYIILGIVALILVVVGYLEWKHNVERIAVLETSLQQVQQSLADQKQFSDRLQKVEQLQDQISANQDAREKAIRQSISNMLDNINKQDNRPASKLLKDTVKQLRDMQ